MQLTSQQIEAINHTHGPALVLSVPGSGKTTVLLHRIKNLSEKLNINTDKILSITFSKNQSLDMQKKWNNLNPDNKAYLSTIHAFSYSVYRSWTKDKKLSYELIEGNKTVHKYNLLQSIAKRLYKFPLPKETLEDFFSIYSLMKNKMISLDKIFEDFPNWRNYNKLFMEYEAEKNINRLLDFDDMLLRTNDILESDDKFRKKIQSTFPFVQLDEAQDASMLQFSILQKLSTDGNNLFLLADDDQSIYGFRGAHPEYLLNFQEIHKDAVLYFLEQNHRSSQEIVQISNKIIQTNKARYNKNVFTSNENKGPISLKKVNNMEQTFEIILKEIEASSGTTAILYRNNVSSYALQLALRENNIEFHLKEKQNFLANWLVKDILNILLLAKYPARLDIFKKIYYKLGAYIKKEHVLELDSSIGNVFENLLANETLNKFYINTYTDLLADFNYLNKISIYRAIKYLLKHTGFSNYLSEHTSRINESSNTNNVIIDTLLYLSKDLNEIEELFDLTQQMFEEKTSFNSNIYLSTIHGAKGLEYDTVILIDLVQGEFPSSSYTNNPAMLEEERRLFYVALTRAKNRLVLISPKNRNFNSVDPSVFYKELLSKK